MNNEFLVGLFGGLDEASSKSQLNSDIESISKKLDKLKLHGELEPNEISNIESKLKNLKASISDITIDQKVINGLVTQINNALKGIKINNVGLNQNGLTQQGRQVGDLLSKGVSDSLNDVSSKKIAIPFIVDKSSSDKFENAVNAEIKDLQEKANTAITVTYKTDVQDVVTKDANGNDITNKVETLTGAVFKYTTATGEAITKTMKWSQIDVDDGGEAIYGWVQGLTTYSKSLDVASTNTDKFIKQQKKAVADVTNQIKQINASAIDPNASRSITDTSNLKSLADKYDEITVAIQKMESASSDTFVDEQNRVKSLIAEYKILVSQYRNAENVNTTMKPDKIAEGTSKILSQFKSLESNIKAANVPLDTLDKNIKQIESVVNKVNNGGILNKAEIETTLTLITRTRQELDALKTKKKNDTILEGLKYDAEALGSALDSFSKKNPGFEKWKLEVDGVEISVESLKNELSTVNNSTDFGLIKKQANDLKASFIAAKKEISTIDNIKLKIDNQTYSKQFSQLVNSFRNLGLSANEVEQKTKQVEAALQQLEKRNLKTLVTDERNFAEALKKAQNEAAILKTDLDKIYNPQKQFKLSTDIQNWLSKNTRASKEARESLTEYYKELQGGKVNVSRLKDIENDLKRIDAEQRGLGKLGKNLKDQFKDAGHSFTQWLSVTNGIMFLIQKSKEAVTELINVDDILTEISKTSELTKDELVELGDAAYDTASKYGRVATDYLKGVQEMYRAGFENADEMAELSLLAQAAGDMDATGANNYIMATNAAYDYKASVKDLNAVLDSQNYITNNAAINMQDMADATSEAASIAAQYGVEIDELSALISVAVSKTRESGSEVGTALKALFINLQDTTSKPIRNAFDGVGISMTKMVNGSEKLKTPIELIKELSIAFNSLEEGSIERANILNDIGGKLYHVVQKCATSTYLIAGNA